MPLLPSCPLHLSLLLYLLLVLLLLAGLFPSRTYPCSPRPALPKFAPQRRATPPSDRSEAARARPAPSPLLTTADGAQDPAALHVAQHGVQSSERHLGEGDAPQGCRERTGRGTEGATVSQSQSSAAGRRAGEKSQLRARRCHKPTARRPKIAFREGQGPCSWPSWTISQSTRPKGPYRSCWPVCSRC